MFRLMSFLFSLVAAFVAGAAVAFVTGADLTASVAVSVSLSVVGGLALSMLPGGVALAGVVPFNGVTSTNEQRAVYTQLADELAGIPNAFATRGSLRLEVVGGNKNRYRFNVLADEGNPLPSERRLARTDAFVVDRIGLFLAKRLIAAEDAPVVPGFAFTESAKTLFSWPNPGIFQGATEYQAAAALLNAGVFTAEIDKVKWLELHDAMASRYVDCAQVGPTGLDYAGDSWRTDQVLARQTPAWRLNGGSTNDLQLFVNEGIDFTGQAFTIGEVEYQSVNTIVCILDGWYLSNAGEFLSRSRP